jgi:hypothetical protein
MKNKIISKGYLLSSLIFIGFFMTSTIQSMDVNRQQEITAELNTIIKRIPNELENLKKHELLKSKEVSKLKKELTKISAEKGSLRNKITSLINFVLEARNMAHGRIPEKTMAQSGAVGVLSETSRDLRDLLAKTE